MHEVHGAAEIHSQPVGKVFTLEQGDARESCGLVGDPNRKRGPASRDRENLASKLEKPILKRLHPMDE